jgi:hypothetical protein
MMRSREAHKSPEAMTMDAINAELAIEKIDQTLL